MSLYTGFTEQKTCRIGGVAIGGLPGANPALLVASVFYHGDELLLNEDEGLIDREKAREAIDYAVSYAGSRGLSFGLDVVVSSRRAVKNILQFVAEYNVPLFLDSPDPDARVEMYSMARDLGIADRSIANGIYINTTRGELEAIRRSGIKAAILLAFDPANPSSSLKPRDRLALLKDKLLALASEAGVECILADAVVLDPASIAYSAEAVYLFKKELGTPAGCAPANALGPVGKKSVEVDDVYGIHGGAAALVRLYGADFIMYGPIKRIKYVAPAVAMVDSLLGYLLRSEGYSVSREHPLAKYLRNIQRLFAKPPS